MIQETANGGCICSCPGSNPDIGDIVEIFVQEMAERIATLLGQLNAKHWDGMRQTAHQLRGAAGSYGFDSISQGAAKVERAVRDGGPDERIRAALDALVGLCLRIRCGTPA